MRCILIPLLSALIAGCLLAGPESRADSITNGDFQTPGMSPDAFAGWATDFGDPPTDGGGFALFSEGASFAVQLQQAITLPVNARSLSFDFQLTAAPDMTGGNPVPDSFQATLWTDATFTDSLLATNPPAFPAFFSNDNTGPQFFNTAVSVTPLGGGYQRVTLDLSGLPLPRSAILEFLLNGGDDGLQTTVKLDNVTVAVGSGAAAPEPGSFIVFCAGGIGLYAAWARRRRSCGRAGECGASPGPLTRPTGKPGEEAEVIGS